MAVCTIISSLISFSLYPICCFCDGQWLSSIQGSSGHSHHQLPNVLNMQSQGLNLGPFTRKVYALQLRHGPCAIFTSAFSVLEYLVLDFTGLHHSYKFLQCSSLIQKIYYHVCSFCFVLFFCCEYLTQEVNMHRSRLIEQEEARQCEFMEIHGHLVTRQNHVSELRETARKVNFYINRMPFSVSRLLQRHQSFCLHILLERLANLCECKLLCIHRSFTMMACNCSWDFSKQRSVSLLVTTCWCSMVCKITCHVMPAGKIMHPIMRPWANSHNFTQEQATLIRQFYQAAPKPSTHTHTNPPPFLVRDITVSLAIG